jgi:hypothetical protein
MINLTKTINSALHCYQNLSDAEKIALKWVFSMLDLGVKKEAAIVVATVKLERAGLEYKHAWKTARDMAELVD